MSRNSSKVRKPFTPDAEAKDALLHKAMSDVQEAMDALTAARDHAENWADFETLIHFKSQLTEFFSSDNGECGFEPYVRATAK